MKLAAIGAWRILLIPTANASRYTASLYHWFDQFVRRARQSDKLIQSGSSHLIGPLRSHRP
jgi:hypothetical protein